MQGETAGSAAWQGARQAGEREGQMENLKTGEVIGKRRRELGLTQNQLASSLNVSFQAVSKWENGVSHS